MLFLEKVDPQFRILADKLFFTDNTDLDLSCFKTLFESNEFHCSYLLDRFNRSLEIFWNEDFWVNRLDVLLSLHSKRIDSEVNLTLLSRFRKMIDDRVNPTPKVDNEFIQFKAWTKVLAARKEDIISIREFFLDLVHSVKVGKITNLVGHFIPHVFQSMNEYLESLGKKVVESSRTFQALKELEKQGVPIDKTPLFKRAKNLLLKRVPHHSNILALFELMDDPEIMAHLKSQYKTEDYTRLTFLIESCSYKELEDFHLRNIRNLLQIDPTVADVLFNHYANQLWSRPSGSRGANVKRLIRLCKAFPDFTPKKALTYLSTTGKMSDIKLLISAFPELKTLAPFI